MGKIMNKALPLVLLLLSACWDEPILLTPRPPPPHPSLPALRQTVPVSATLSWDIPLEKVDGTPAQLEAFMIFWGEAPGEYTQTIKVSPSTTLYTVNDFSSAGTWYFVIRAVEVGGNVSDLSNEVSKTVQ
jgi:hypothetical protein